MPGRKQIPSLEIASGTTAQRDNSYNLTTLGNLFYNEDTSNVEIRHEDPSNNAAWRDFVINNKEQIDISGNVNVVGDISTNNMIVNDVSVKGDIYDNRVLDDYLVGQISFFSHGDISASKWQPCDGSILTKSVYQDLYDAIGDNFTTPLMDQSFAIPDLRDRFICGGPGSRPIFRPLGYLGEESWKGLYIESRYGDNYYYSHNTLYPSDLVLNHLNGTGTNVFTGRWSQPASKIRLKWIGPDIKPNNTVLRICIKIC